MIRQRAGFGEAPGAALSKPSQRNWLPQPAAGGGGGVFGGGLLGGGSGTGCCGGGGSPGAPGSSPGISVGSVGSKLEPPAPLASPAVMLEPPAPELGGFAFGSSPTGAEPTCSVPALPAAPLAGGLALPGGGAAGATPGALGFAAAFAG